MKHDELLTKLNVLEHLRDLPVYKNIRSAIEREIAEFDASLGPKPEPAPKAVPTAKTEK